MKRATFVSDPTVCVEKCKNYFLYPGGAVCTCQHKCEHDVERTLEPKVNVL